MNAAENGHLDCLKFLIETVYSKILYGSLNSVASYGHLHMVKYLVGINALIGWYECLCAADNGHLDCLKYLCENSDVRNVYRQLAESGHLSMEVYILEELHNTPIHDHYRPEVKACYEYLYQKYPPKYKSYPSRYRKQTVLYQYLNSA